MTPKSENKLVLLVMNKQNIFFHVGDPDLFEDKVLADYAKGECTFRKITLKKYQQLNLKLYEKLPDNI